MGIWSISICGFDYRLKMARNKDFLLSGATQGNQRADSDEETGMNEPKYLLLHREMWSADPGKLG